jgi:glutamate synthase domain-containing protein 3
MAKSAKQTDNCKILDAAGLYYRELNSMIRELASNGCAEIVLDGVNGQRYIADGLREKVRIVINGVPGNDLGAFMDGPTVIVNENAQDGVGNTMNSGKIVVKGHAGDVIGYGMRGGKVFVGGNVGYRVGIHMKSYKDQVPIIVAGGRAGDFFGEYMAGGLLVLLGMGDEPGPVAGSYLGTGMHGGTIYVRGELKEHQLGREVREFPVDDDDRKMLSDLLAEFASDTEMDLGGIAPEDFKKLEPFSHRPYGNLYVY